MKDLLLRWAELETESRCRLNDGCIEFRIGDERLIQVYVDPLEDYPPEVFACVQLAVQEAIVKRDWSFRTFPVKHYLDFGTTAVCCNVQYAADVVIPTENDEELIYVSLKRSAAESLLSAYLQALEAVETEEAA